MPIPLKDNPVLKAGKVQPKGEPTCSSEQFNAR
jgi:hypothetical protein